ncbi:hypothetical protein M430DRAFT_25278 [Amorphotheca resinae ATCC 22711]|uniref:Uncharacterized protein n=1 Tax=Amorphotheca resinae ATCC 22711 TaxID=857342 RepID=A0A2T3BAX2_AMORE|nr:hypothetical protein M430DRAFT_25278 [Amorphotheca resinae ATCC 22711]PSS25487.1 hypothetical protein M430DRAFT_25278 [Amorphotheca resinae ATCC 22711]
MSLHIPDLTLDRWTISSHDNSPPASYRRNDLIAHPFKCARADWTPHRHTATPPHSPHLGTSDRSRAIPNLPFDPRSPHEPPLPLAPRPMSFESTLGSVIQGQNCLWMKRENGIFFLKRRDWEGKPRRRASWLLTEGTR